MRRWFVVALIALMSLGGCVGFGRGDLQNFIGATIPNDVENFEFKTNPNPTRIIWVKFDTSEAIATDFAADLGIADNFFADENMTFNYDREPEWWWDGASGYQGARATLGTKAYQMVIVPITEEIVRVYLEVFEY